VAGAAERLEPRLIVLSSVTPKPIRAAGTELRELASRYRVAVGGAGAARLDPDEVGVLILPGDSVAEAARVARLVGGTDDEGLSA
jgi:hypothetical protein